jgi:hypothetical protein
MRSVSKINLPCVGRLMLIGRGDLVRTTPFPCTPMHRHVFERKLAGIGHAVHADKMGRPPPPAHSSVPFQMIDFTYVCRLIVKWLIANPEFIPQTQLVVFALGLPVLHFRFVFVAGQNPVVVAGNEILQGAKDPWKWQWGCFQSFTILHSKRTCLDAIEAIIAYLVQFLQIGLISGI